MRLDRNARIWHGGLPSRAGGGAKGALDACSRGKGGDSAKSGLQKCRLRRKIMHAQMPWGALSGARWLPSTGNVFWAGGINSRVSVGHSWKYMHIRAVYMHIRHIHTNTIKYMHIRTYTVSQSDCAAREQYRCTYVYIFMHIRHTHTHTYIYVHIRSAFICVHISVSC